MKEKNSMLVHFQKLCKTLSWNFPNFAWYRRTTWFRWALEARISQKVSCYLESENMDALISLCCSALQRGISASAELFIARIRVSEPPKYNFIVDLRLLHCCIVLQHERPVESRISLRGFSAKAEMKENCVSNSTKAWNLSKRTHTCARTHTNKHTHCDTHAHTHAHLAARGQPIRAAPLYPAVHQRIPYQVFYMVMPG